MNDHMIALLKVVIVIGTTLQMCHVTPLFLVGIMRSYYIYNCLMFNVLEIGLQNKSSTY